MASDFWKSVLGAVPVIGGIYGALQGSKSANNANALSQQAQGLQTQQYYDYGKPYMDMQLDRAQGDQPTLNYQRSLMNAMSGSYPMGSYTELPWWAQTPQNDVQMPNVPDFDASQMPESYQIDPQLIAALQGTPDWRNPFTKEQQGALSTLSDLNLSGYMNNVASSRAGLAQQMGMPISREQAGMAPGVQNLIMQARAREKANTALMGMQRGDQLRGENVTNLTNLGGIQRNSSNDALQRFLLGQGLARDTRNEQRQQTMLGEDIGKSRRTEGANNYFNMANLYNNGATQYMGMANASPWANMYGNQANNYQNQATQYGNMFGQGISGLLQGIGSYYGNKAPSASAGGGYGNALNNYKLPWE